MKLPIITGKEMVAFLIKLGFHPKRQKGSHVILYKKNALGKGLYVTVALHANKEISPGTLLSILEQAELTKEVFFRLWK